MTNLRSLLPLEATDGGHWTKIQLPCGCWEHLMTYLAVSCMGGSYIFLLRRHQFVFFLPKGESEAPGVHSLAPFGFWVCTVIGLGFWVPFWPWASAAPMESTSKGTCSAGPWSRCLWQKPTLQEKNFSQTVPTSETQPLHANRSCPHTPFHVQAVGCQPFFPEEKAVAGKWRKTWILCPPRHWFSPSCPLLAPSAPVCALLERDHLLPRLRLRPLSWVGQVPLLQYRYCFRAWTSL